MAISLYLLSKENWNTSGSDDENIAAGNRTWSATDTNKIDTNMATVEEAINDLQAASGGGDFLPLTGGTLTGALSGTTATFSGVVIGATPTADTHLATKAYVDSAIPSLADYVTNSALDTKLADYSTTTQMTSAISTATTGMVTTSNFNITIQEDSAFKTLSENHNMLQQERIVSAEYTYNETTFAPVSLVLKTEGGSDITATLTPQA